MRRSLDLRRPICALLALAASGLTQDLSAQKLSPQRKIEFAQGLAAELGFVDLAEGLLEEVRKEGGSFGREELARATLQVIRLAIPNSGLGITSAEPAERGQAFKERIRAYDRALSAYGEYLSSGAKLQRGDTINEMLKLVREKLEIAMRFIEDEDVSKEIRDEIARSSMEVDASGRPQSPRHWATAVTEAQVIINDLAQRVEAVEDAMWDEDEGSPAFLELEAQANALSQKRYEAMFMVGEV
ncbi:MAG: hypothetical protein H6834_15795, partial [Planctomycetes bacterium]|nr:hypothetical protein [Planctomycetota bacterium]